MEILSVTDIHFEAASSNSITYLGGCIQYLKDGKEYNFDFSGTEYEYIKLTAKINEMFATTDPELWTVERWVYSPIKGEYSANVPLSQEDFLEIVQACELDAGPKTNFEIEKAVNCVDYVLSLLIGLISIYPDREQLID